MREWIMFLAPAGLACLLLALMIARAFFARARFELRAQVFEILSLATARQMPLGPVFLEAREGERGHRGKLLSELASRFQDGGTVADTLHQAAPRLFGEHHIGAIRSSEGSAMLSPTVHALSADSGRGDAARHRLSMALCYPALLAVFLVIGQAATSSIVTRCSAAGVAHSHIGASAVVTNLFASAVFLFCGFAVMLRLSLDRTGNIPSWFSRPVRFVPIFARMTSWVAMERALRTLSVCVASGGGLPGALRGAASASGHKQTCAQFTAAAQKLEAGESIEVAFEACGLPDSVVARVISASTGTTHSFAAGLERLARECGHGFNNDLQRIVQWAQPVILLVFGLALSMQFMEFFGVLESIRPEMIWW